MSNVTSTQNLYKQTQPVWNMTINGYPLLPKEFSKWIPTKHIDTWDWKVNQINTIGIPGEVAEQENAPIASFGDYGSKVFIPRKYMLGIQITEEAIKFNLYKEDCPKIVEQFKRSFQTREEILAASIINNGWNPQYTGLDGQELFSPTHYVSNGDSFANTFDHGAPMQEDILESMITMMRRFLDTSGQPIRDSECEQLIASVEMEWQIIRLTQSYLSPGTGNNAINSLKFLNVIKDYSLSHFVSPIYFAMRTNQPGVIKIINDELSLNYSANTINQVITSICSYRLGFFFFDPRSMVGATQPLTSAA